jgi:hypothetical protein
VGQELPKGPPELWSETGLSAHLRGSPWDENIVRLAALEGCEEEKDRPGSILLGPQELMAQIRIGVHPVDLMVDTGTEHSVVTQPVSPLSQKHTTIIGATEDQACHPFLVSRQCNLGSHEVRHKFLYLPNCPLGPMGRD